MSAIFPASFYIKSHTPEEYSLSSQQYTVPQRDGDYIYTLNSHGWAQYTEAKHIAETSPTLNTIDDYFLAVTESGQWCPRPSSNYYDPSDTWHMKTYNNIIVCGWITVGDTKKIIGTSPCVFYTDTWCLTKSGTIYKLGRKHLS